MIVRFSPRSRDDLARILAFVDEHSPTGARNVRDAIRRSFRLIGEFPTVGAQLESGVRCVPVPRYPYLVYYLVGVETVDVLHIRHAARDGARL